MKTVSIIFGVILLVLSILGGLYVGFWVMFVGGIVDIIDAIKAPVTSMSAVGWGLIKILLASFIGGITFWAGAIISSIFLNQR